MQPLALTMGDPAGIGGELTLRSWLMLRACGPAFVALDDPVRLAALVAQLELDVPIRIVDSADQAGTVFSSALPVLPLPLAVTPVPGRPERANAKAVVRS